MVWLHRLFTMTKKELIDALNEIPLDDDTPVVVTCIGEDVESGSDLYKIRVNTVESYNLDGRDGSVTIEYEISIEANNSWFAWSQVPTKTLQRTSTNGYSTYTNKQDKTILKTSKHHVQNQIPPRTRRQLHEVAGQAP